MRLVELLAIAIGLAAQLVGCRPCVHQASVQKQWERRNRDRAEPAIDRYSPFLPPGACLTWSDDRRVFRLKAEGEKPHLAVPVPSEDWEYARLARRDHRLLVLVPRVTRRTVGDETACLCDGMPHPVYPRAFAFVIDDVDRVEVEEVSVPMTEDVIEWKCKAIGA